MRQDRFAEETLPAKHQDSENDKKKLFKKNQLLLISFRTREDL